MNGDQICFRLPATLRAQIKRDAAQRGITRTNWIIHLIERVLLPTEKSPPLPIEK